MKALYECICNKGSLNTYVNICLYVMSLIEGVYLYSTSSQRQGTEMSGTPKTFFWGAL